MKSSPESFRKLLLAYLKRNKLSQRQAAPKLGVSTGSLSHWLRGKNGPSSLYLAHLLPLLKK